MADGINNDENTATNFIHTRDHWFSCEAMRIKYRMDSLSATATFGCKTRMTRAFGFWGERVEGIAVNKYGSFERFKSISTRTKPGFVMNALASDDLLRNHGSKLEHKIADPKKVLSIILGGGSGTELFPLTTRTATPAVPVGGCCKLIDIPMSNSINSGINKIYILTQFNSAFLNRHIHQAYSARNASFMDGFVEVLAATQTPGEAGMKWFQGTADAIRQFIWLLEDVRSKDVENIVVLSGDHLYRMDYMDLVQHHIDKEADITVSCVPVDESRASRYGLMKVDNNGRVVEFCEKPKGRELMSMVSSGSVLLWFKSISINNSVSRLASLQNVFRTILGPFGEIALQKPYIASMGVYVFKKETLLDLLKRRYPAANDFGTEIIPAAVKEVNVQAYLFNDYWEDIGTLKAFYEANIDLTKEVVSITKRFLRNLLMNLLLQKPKFEFYDLKTPFYTSPQFLPPTKMDNCKIKDAIVSHGCFLKECVIERSIVGARSRLDYGVQLKDTMMMGADTYQTEEEIAALLDAAKVPIGIGCNTKITKCIIDKNAMIGKNVIIKNKDGIQEADRPSEGYYIRSGVIIIMEKAIIPDGTVI
ncbi:hypothetical protein V2J09_001916 [Rumex salicifolius]